MLVRPSYFQKSAQSSCCTTPAAMHSGKLKSVCLRHLTVQSTAQRLTGPINNSKSLGYRKFSQSFDAITLHTAVRLFDIGVALEVVLVNNASCPCSIIVSFVQTYEGIQTPLACLPCHEVVDWLVEWPRCRQQFFGALL